MKFQAVDNMKKIRITEEQYKRLINESDSRYDKFIKLITDTFSNTFNVNDRVSGSEYYVNNDENTTWLKYLTYNFRHSFNLMQNSDVKLLYHFAKIAYEDLKFDFNDDYQQERTILKQIINLCKQKTELYNKYIQGKDLNFKQLYSIFKPILEQIKKDETNIINNTEYKKNINYEIIEVKNFEQANDIGFYSGCDGEGKLCYTAGKKTWEEFTQRGASKVYCCLIKNWKNIPAQRTEGYPKDEYGLSMIFVFIDQNGDISNSNVRWNHGDGDYSDVDNMFTKSELSEIIGVKFNEVFKPYSREELRSKGVILFDEIQELLDSGELPEDIFNIVYDFKDGFRKVGLNDKYNYINENGKLISDTWFDGVSGFNNGFCTVGLNEKINLINKNGKLISDTWLDYAGDFYNGFCPIKLNDKYNLINTEGKFISEIWFDGVSGFRDGFSTVRLNDKYNYFNTEGKLISDTWFDDISGDFRGGFSSVVLNGKHNLINKEGKLISDTWFDVVYGFSQNGLCEVELNGKFYKIDANGKLYNMDMTPVNESIQSNKRKKIRITEEQLNIIELALNQSTPSFDNFMKEVKLFLYDALSTDGEQIKRDFFKMNGVSNRDVLNKLFRFGIIEKVGENKIAVPKKNFDRKVNRFYYDLFPEDDLIEEEVGGAGSVGGSFEAPLMLSPIRRKIGGF